MMSPPPGGETIEEEKKDKRDGGEVICVLRCCPLLPHYYRQLSDALLCGRTKRGDINSIPNLKIDDFKFQGLIPLSTLDLIIR